MKRCGRVHAIIAPRLIPYLTNKHTIINHDEPALFMLVFKKTTTRIGLYFAINAICILSVNTISTSGVEKKKTSSVRDVSVCVCVK